MWEAVKQDGRLGYRGGPGISALDFCRMCCLFIHEFEGVLGLTRLQMNKVKKASGV